MRFVCSSALTIAHSSGVRIPCDRASEAHPPPQARLAEKHRHGSPVASALPDFDAFSSGDRRRRLRRNDQKEQPDRPRFASAMPRPCRGRSRRRAGRPLCRRRARSLPSSSDGGDTDTVSIQVGTSSSAYRWKVVPNETGARPRSSSWRATPVRRPSNSIPGTWSRGGQREPGERYRLATASGQDGPSARAPLPLRPPGRLSGETNAAFESSMCCGASRSGEHLLSSTSRSSGPPPDTSAPAAEHRATQRRTPSSPAPTAGSATRSPPVNRRVERIDRRLNHYAEPSVDLAGVPLFQEGVAEIDPVDLRPDRGVPRPLPGPAKYLSSCRELRCHGMTS
jgi:hypothetical protein